MSRAYSTEDEKLVYSPFPKWTLEEQKTIERILREKGYLVTCVTRVGCDRRWHDSWQVIRQEVPQLIEELFRQRLVVEVQAEGQYKASINFCYDYHADTVISAVHRFRKNKLNGGKL